MANNSNTVSNVRVKKLNTPQQRGYKTSTRKATSPWLANAVRSIGLASSEVFKEMAPNITSVIGTSQETLRQVTSLARSNNIKSAQDAFKNNMIIRGISQAMNNAIDDLKTGNFHNTARAQKATDEATAKMMGLDEDFGGIDFSDWGDEGANIQFNNIQTGGNFDIAVDEIRKGNVANLQGHKAVMDSIVAVSSASMMQSQQIGNQIISSLSNISSSLNAIADFQNETMSQFIQTMTGYMEKTGMLLEESVSGSSAIRGVDLFDSKGALNFGNYKKYVGKRFGDTLVGQLYGMGKDDGFMEAMFKQVVANPLGLVMKEGMKALMPAVVESTVKSMDETVRDFIPKALHNLYRNRNNSNSFIFGQIKEFIGNVFGLRDDRKNSFDVAGKISAQATPFDKATRHAIIEVIPKYLRESTAYLEGIAGRLGVNTKNQRDRADVFDYENGVYKTLQSVKREFIDEIHSAMRTGFEETPFGRTVGSIGDILNENIDPKVYRELLDEWIRKLSAENKDSTKRFSSIGAGSDYAKFNEKFFSNNNSNEAKVLAEVLKEAAQHHDGGDISLSLLKANASRSERMRLMEDDPTRKGLYRVFSSSVDNPDDLDKFIDNENRLIDALRIGNSHPANDNFFVRVDESQKSIARALGISNVHQSRNMPSIVDYLSDIRSLLDRGINVAVDKKRKKYGPLASPKVVAESGVHDQGMDTGDTSSLGDLDNGTTEEVESQKRDLTDEEISQMVHDKSTRHFAEKGNRETNAARHFRNAANAMLHMNIGGAMNEIQGMFSEQVTDVFNVMNEKLFTPLRDQLFGTKNKDSGYFENGLLAGVNNSMIDAYKRLERIITGKGYTDSKRNKYEDTNGTSVKDLLKKTFSSLREDVTTFIFGPIKVDENGNPILDKNGKTQREHKEGNIIGMMTDTIKAGFKGWREALFGEDEEDGTNKNLEAAKKYMEDAAPNGIAGGMAGGILGMFVGGPLLGALSGAAIGFASKSKSFQEFVFGRDDEVTGRHIEGIISKDVQDAFKDPKTRSAIVGGGALGAIHGAVTGGGLLGSLVGGPLAGAIIGSTLGIVSKSDIFQDFLFGPMDKNGQRTGKVSTWNKGIVNRIKEMWEKSTTNKNGDVDGGKLLGMNIVGAGAGVFTGSLVSSMGLLPAFMTPVGPIGGALLGLSLSMKASAKGFKEFLFGKTDERGNYHAGLLKKVANSLAVNLLDPIRDTVDFAIADAKYFFRYTFFGTIETLFDPIVKAFKNTKELFGNITNALTKPFKNLFTKIFENITDAMDFVLAPIKTASTFAINVMVGAAKETLMLPVRLVGIATNTFNLIYGATVGAVNKVTGFIGEHVKKLFIDPLLKAAVDKVNWIASGIKVNIIDPLVARVVEPVKQIFGGLFKVIGTVITSPFRLLKGLAKSGSEITGLGLTGFLDKNREEGAAKQSLKDMKANRRTRAQNERMIYKATGGAYKEDTEENRRRAEEMYADMIAKHKGGSAYRHLLKMATRRGAKKGTLDWGKAADGTALRAVDSRADMVDVYDENGNVVSRRARTQEEKNREDFQNIVKGDTETIKKFTEGEGTGFKTFSERLAEEFKTQFSSFFKGNNSTDDSDKEFNKHTAAVRTGRLSGRSMFDRVNDPMRKEQKRVTGGIAQGDIEKNEEDAKFANPEKYKELTREDIDNNRRELLERDKEALKNFKAFWLGDKNNPDEAKRHNIFGRLLNSFKSPSKRSFATGGAVIPGPGAYMGPGGVPYKRILVGEQGPELAEVPVGTYIHNNQETNRIAGLYNEDGTPIPGYGLGGLVTLLGGLASGVGTVLHIGSGLLGGAFDIGKNVVGGALSLGKGAIEFGGNIIKGAGDMIRSAANNGKQFISNIGTGAKNVVKRVGGFFKGVGSTFTDALGMKSDYEKQVQAGSHAAQEEAKAEQDEKVRQEQRHQEQVAANALIVSKLDAQAEREKEDSGLSIPAMLAMLVLATKLPSILENTASLIIGGVKLANDYIVKPIYDKVIKPWWEGEDGNGGVKKWIFKTLPSNIYKWWTGTGEGMNENESPKALVTKKIPEAIHDWWYGSNGDGSNGAKNSLFNWWNGIDETGKPSEDSPKKFITEKLPGAIGDWWNGKQDDGTFDEKNSPKAFVTSIPGKIYDWWNGTDTEPGAKDNFKIWWEGPDGKSGASHDIKVWWEGENGSTGARDWIGNQIVWAWEEGGLKNFFTKDLPGFLLDHAIKPGASLLWYMTTHGGSIDGWEWPPKTHETITYKTAETDAIVHDLSTPVDMDTYTKGISSIVALRDPNPGGYDALWYDYHSNGQMTKEEYLKNAKTSFARKMGFNTNSKNFDDVMQDFDRIQGLRDRLDQVITDGNFTTNKQTNGSAKTSYKNAVAKLDEAVDNGSLTPELLESTINGLDSNIKDNNASAPITAMREYYSAIINLSKESKLTAHTGNSGYRAKFSTVLGQYSRNLDSVDNKDTFIKTLEAQGYNASITSNAGEYYDEATKRYRTLNRSIDRKHSDSDKINKKVTKDIESIINTLDNKVANGTLKQSDIDNIRFPEDESGNHYTTEAEEKAIKDYFNYILLVSNEKDAIYSSLSHSKSANGTTSAVVPVIITNESGSAGNFHLLDQIGITTSTISSSSYKIGSNTVGAKGGRGTSPIDMAAYAKSHGFRDDTGTNWNFIDSATRDYGLNADKQYNPSKGFIMSQLASGNPVILSGQGGPGSPYTEGGHYVVATGMYGNGININDPRGPQYSGIYDLNSVVNGANVGWGMSNGGYGNVIPLYSQNDPAWANTAYGDERFGDAGCGPTAMSMVLSGLKKSNRGGRGLRRRLLRGGRRRYSGGRGGNYTDMANGFPYLHQADDRWGMYPYPKPEGSNSTISSSGCGPTACAMMLRSYGINVSPIDTADLARECGARYSGGTHGRVLFPAAAKKYGLESDAGISFSKAVEYLKKGIPVGASMVPGHFTRYGHFIVLCGITEDGRIYVNDPNNNGWAQEKYKLPTTQTACSPWDPNIIASEYSYGCTLSKNGKGSIGNLYKCEPLKVEIPIGSQYVDIGTGSKSTNAATALASGDSTSSETTTTTTTTKQKTKPTGILGALSILGNAAAHIGDALWNKIIFGKPLEWKATVNDLLYGGNDTYTTTTTTTDSSGAMYADSNSIDLPDEERKKVIWDRLRESGFSEETVAGIMGNFETESSNDPKTFEGCYMKSYPGAAAMEDQANVDDFVSNKLFPAYRSKKIPLHEDYYTIADENGVNHYYPGLGLAQWTGPMNKELKAFSKNKSRPWYDLGNQLDFFWNGADNPALNKFKSNLSSNPTVASATAGFYKDYEAQTSIDVTDPSNSYSYKNYQGRLKNAEKIYAKFKGSQIDTDINGYLANRSALNNKSSIWWNRYVNSPKYTKIIDTAIQEQMKARGQTYQEAQADIFASEDRLTNFWTNLSKAEQDEVDKKFDINTLTQSQNTVTGGSGGRGHIRVVGGGRGSNSLADIKYASVRHKPAHAGNVASHSTHLYHSALPYGGGYGDSTDEILSAINNILTKMDAMIGIGDGIMHNTNGISNLGSITHNYSDNPSTVNNVMLNMSANGSSNQSSNGGNGGRGDSKQPIIFVNKGNNEQIIQTGRKSRSAMVAEQIASGF